MPVTCNILGKRAQKCAVPNFYTLTVITKLNLSFKRPGYGSNLFKFYTNIKIWIYQLKDILWKIKQDYAACLKKIFLLPKYRKLISRCAFVYKFTYVKGLLKVKAEDIVL